MHVSVCGVCVCVFAVYKYSCQIVRRTGAHWAYDKRAIYFGTRRLFDFLSSANFCTNVRALFVAIVLGINQFYEWHISVRSAPLSSPADPPSCNLQALFISCPHGCLFIYCPKSLLISTCHNGNAAPAKSLSASSTHTYTHTHAHTHCL